MASLVLGVAGAIVGGIFGGPMGAQAGFVIGSSIGASIDAPSHEGPRMTDLKVQSSQYGEMIPIVYGQSRISGTVIWADLIKEHKNKIDSGSGGGGATYYTYTCSFAVSVCEGPKKVVRIWADSKLVYDESLGRCNLKTNGINAYPGNEYQMPDGTIEAVMGAGNAPAYRGQSYMVFTDLELGKFGNRIPNFTFEVMDVERTGLVEHIATTLPRYPFELVRSIVDPHTGWVWVLYPGDSTDLNAYYHVEVFSDNPKIGKITTLTLPRVENCHVVDIGVYENLIFIIQVSAGFLINNFDTTNPWVQFIYSGESGKNTGKVIKLPGLLGIAPWGTPAFFDKKMWMGTDPPQLVLYERSVAPPYLNGAGGSMGNEEYPKLWFRQKDAGDTFPYAKCMHMCGSGGLMLSANVNNTQTLNVGLLVPKNSLGIFSSDKSIGIPFKIVGDNDYGCVVGDGSNENVAIVDLKNYTAISLKLNYDQGINQRFAYDSTLQRFASVSLQGKILTYDIKTKKLLERTIDLPEWHAQDPVKSLASSSFNGICYDPVDKKYYVVANNGSPDQDDIIPTTIYVINPISLEVEDFYYFEAPSNQSYFVAPLMMPARPDRTKNEETGELEGQYPAIPLYVLALDTGNLKRYQLGLKKLPALLSNVVKDVGLRTGLGEDQLDVAGLNDEVKGYTLTHMMTGRGALEPLAASFFFDSVESSGAVKFRQRGTTIIPVTIDNQDLIPEDPNA